MKVRTWAQVSGEILEPEMLEMQDKALSGTNQELGNWVSVPIPARLSQTTFKENSACYLPTLKGSGFSF